MVNFKQLFRAGVCVSLGFSSSAIADSVPPNQSSYTLFESGQVRPLALSKNGKLLFAVNTPDNHLEVFDATDDQLRHCGSLSVGLEPVAGGKCAISMRYGWLITCPIALVSWP